MNRGPTLPNTLHLRFQTKYSLRLIANKTTRIFGDNAFDGNATFDYNKKTNNLFCNFWLRCNDKLSDYSINQHIFVKAVMWTKNKTITSKLLTKDCIILPKQQNTIKWTIEKNVKSVLEMITIYIKMTYPAKAAMIPFVPTFKEIVQEIYKLSEKQIAQAREDFDQWLDKGCKHLIYETLEEEIANKLIKNKQTASQQRHITLQQRQTPQQSQSTTQKTPAANDKVIYKLKLKNTTKSKLTKTTLTNKLLLNKINKK